VPVVDASVVVDLIAPDTGPDSPVRALFAAWASTGAELLAPGLLWLEAENALLTGIRRGRWSGADADAAAALLDRIPARRVTDDRDTGRAFELARRYDNWPVYDMLYVAIAERTGQEFVTSDGKLQARLAHLGWVRLPDPDPGDLSWAMARWAWPLGPEPALNPGSGDRILHTVSHMLFMPTPWEGRSARRVGAGPH
jgi:predicted nucleic acid-binding protein